MGRQRHRGEAPQQKISYVHFDENSTVSAACVVLGIDHQA
jgi:hypothetical protein